MLLSNRGIPVEVHGNGRFVLPARDFVPAYLKTHEEGRLRAKVDEALEALRSCTLCPRNCKTNRLENRFAVCKVGRFARVASFFHHFGEEDVLRGWRGSGTIFFSWCNLRCVFCFSPDTRVLTDRGFEPIEDIFAAGGREMALNGGTARFLDGLRVWTRGGKLAPVSKAFCHPYRGEMVVLKPYGLPPLLATPDHEVFAAVGPRGPVQKVLAGALTRAHWLVVPKPGRDGPQSVLDVRSLLKPRVTRILRSTRRKAPLSLVIELAGLGAAPRPTSRQIGEQLGYHPVAVRNLLTKIRRGQVESDDEFILNGLVENGGRVRLKTEKGKGVPAHLTMGTDLARLLGYFCAKGHIATSKGRPNASLVVFSYGGHELDLVDRTCTLVREIFGLDPTIRTRPTTVAVEVGSTSLALCLESLCGNKAHGKRVPPPLFAAPPEVVRAFLEGYFEGDGSRLPPCLAANTVSEELAFGIVALLLRLGIFPYFYATPRAAVQNIEGRQVRQSEILYYVKCRLDSWDGQPPSERPRYGETDEAFLVPLRRISHVWYDGPVYNLEVADPDHSYTASGVAVANCQNFDTSQIGEGIEVSPGDLARMMLQLQTEGCHNINFVTPEHVVPQILEALLVAVEGGLRLPLVYNTGAYDSIHSMQLMDGVVDIYMPDFKLWDRERSRRYLLAPDYPEAARGVIRAMHEQVGVLKVNEDGVALRGVLVRHLVMPGMLDDTREIMRYLAGLSPDTFVNVMDQYRPAWRASTDEKFREINRRIFPKELDEAYAHARAAGLWRFDTRWRRVLAWA